MAKLSMSVFVLLSLVVVHPAAAAPAAATLVAPSGDVVGTTIAFSWQSVPTSTWYLFWLGKGTPTAFIMEQWYSAEQAGCANGGTCTITLTPPINGGSHTWFVQTWGAGVTGPWSTGKVFVVKDPMVNWSSLLPDARRFTLVFNGEAVLDNETGLVWDRAPVNDLFTWWNALLYCDSLQRATRKGWRMPTLTELHSLVDTSRINPALPTGHPFDLGTSKIPWFWSQTFYGEDERMVVIMSDGSMSPWSDSTTWRIWCVRSPAAAIW